MTLIVHELKAHGLSQSVTPSKNTIVEAIRPHIYRHNFPTGSLKLHILNPDEDVIAESESIDIEDIGSLDFFHGYVRFYINAYLQKDIVYTIKLISEGGYTFDESAYCGWVNGYDLGKYDPTETPLNDLTFPFDLEIWKRTEK